MFKDVGEGVRCQCGWETIDRDRGRSDVSGHPRWPSITPWGEVSDSRVYYSGLLLKLSPPVLTVRKKRSCFRGRSVGRFHINVGEANFSGVLNGSIRNFFKLWQTSNRFTPWPCEMEQNINYGGLEIRYGGGSASLNGFILLTPRLFTKCVKFIALKLPGE